MVGSLCFNHQASDEQLILFHQTHFNHKDMKHVSNQLELVGTVKLSSWKFYSSS